MKIKIALGFLALTGCSVNIPLNGPQLTDEQQDLINQESKTLQEKIINQTLLPEFLEGTATKQDLDHKNSLDFYRWAALKGYQKAYVVLADQYLQQNPANEKEALYWLEKGIKEEDPLSMMRLARYYSYEKAPAMHEQSLTLIAPLIKLEFLPAIRLAADISKMQGDQAKQLTYLNQAVQLGDIDSEHRLHQIIGNNRDYDSAQQNYILEESPYKELEDLKGFWEKSKVVQRHDDHLTDLTPNKVTQSAKEHDTLKELIQIAHSQNSPYASLILANEIFSNGFKSYDDRRNYKGLLKSALNINSAKTLYARSILRGMIDGEPEEKALSLLQDAAQNDDPYALFYLSLYERIVKKDLAASTKLYYKALSVDTSHAGQYNVALDLQQEYLPFTNQKTANQWFIDLAYNDYPPALLKVAALKEDKKILSQNATEVFLHRAKAAYLGSPEACYLVGDMYLKGTAVQANPKKAFLWIMHAARAGYAPAQYQLSLMYKNGLGVIEDPVKSYAWFTLLPEIFEFQDSFKDDLVESMNHRQLAQALETSKVLKEFYQVNQSVFS